MNQQRCDSGYFEMTGINAFYRNSFSASYATQLFGSASKSGASSSGAESRSATATPTVSSGSGAFDRAIARISEILTSGVGGEAKTASVDENMGFITRANGTKNDDTLTFSARSVSNVTAGAGADTIDIKADAVNNISGEAGKDQISIAARIITRIYAGDDDDTINLTGTTVLDVDGGAGNDTIRISAQTILDVNGGDGNDTIELEGTRISAAGGKGNDTVTFRQTGGSKSSAEYTFDRGDGVDTVNTNGPLSIRLGDYMASDVTVTTKDNTLTISFKDSEDKITVNLAGTASKAKTPDYSTSMDGGYLVLKIA